MLTGWGAVTLVMILVDYVMWTPMVTWLGPLRGGLTMTLIALVLNLGLIWAYDTLKRDFLSFEAIREFETSQHQSMFKRMVVRLMKASRTFAFIGLSIYDPFLAVIFARKEAGAYRMSKRDWVNLLIAMVIAGGGWTIVCYGIGRGFIVGLKWLTSL